MSLANRTNVFDETVVNAETDSKEDDIESEHAPAHDFGQSPTKSSRHYDRANEHNEEDDDGAQQTLIVDGI